MTDLIGGAYAPDPRDFLTEDDARDAARAGAEVLAQHRSEPSRPRSRWELRRVEGELTWVEVERLEPPPDEDEGTAPLQPGPPPPRPDGPHPPAGSQPDVVDDSEAQW